MIRYQYLISACAVLASLDAAETDSSKRSSSAASARSAGKLFQHRTDLRVTHGDPTFKIFRVVERAKATHPRGLKGSYELSVAFIVEVDGTVREAAISKPSGSPALDAAYVETIKGWKFVPAEVGGKPIPYVVVQPFSIEL